MNEQLLVPKVCKLLLSCRRPISVSSLLYKKSYNKSSYHYLNCLLVNGLVTSKEIITHKGKEKELMITDKGRRVLALWIELNSMLGVKVCLYL